MGQLEGRPREGVGQPHGPAVTLDTRAPLSPHITVQIATAEHLPVVADSRSPKRLRPPSGRDTQSRVG